MFWIKNDPAKLVETRFQLACSETVFKELQLYDSHIKAHGPYSGNKDLEKSLLARDDQLINLGLAQYGSCSEIILSLLERASKVDRNKDQELYHRALRLACLANSNHNDWDWPNKGKWKELIDPILLGENGDESYALLTNPEIKGSFLLTLFSREDIFQNMPSSIWLSMVSAVSENPRLNADNSSEHGPDFDLWDIQKGIIKFLTTAPISEKNIVGIAHTLLNALDPSLCSTSDEILPTIEKWRLADASNYNVEEQEGYYTQLCLKDELLCLIAALYGKYYRDNKFTIIGSPNDNDIVLRCAYYGNADLTVKEMEAAHLKDGFAFVFAALKNNLLYLNKEKRAELESYVGGDNLWIYRRHCEQLHKRNKWFDPKPVSEYGREVTQDLAQKKSADSTMLEEILIQNDVLKKRLDNYERKSYWAIIIIFTFAYLLRR